jgi:hypothetical protein
MAKDFHGDDKKMVHLAVAARVSLSPLHATVGKLIPR